MAKYEDDDDLEIEDTDSAEEVETEDAEEEEQPKKKIKAKVKVDEDEEEAPKPKKKVAKASADDEEEEKRVVSRKPKSKGKEGKKMATKTVEKKHRSPKRSDKPYGDDSVIGTVYNLALKGVSLKKAKAIVEKNKTGKTPMYWVLTDLRRGEWKTAAGLWKWNVDQEALESGILKISPARLKQAKVAA